MKVSDSPSTRGSPGNGSVNGSDKSRLRLVACDSAKIATSCSGRSALASPSRYMLRPEMRLAPVRARIASCKSVT